MECQGLGVEIKRIKRAYISAPLAGEYAFYDDGFVFAKWCAMYEQIRLEYY